MIVERLNYEFMNTTKNATIPFQIMVDARTVMIASAILQQAAVRAYGFTGVSALKPAVVKSHLYGDIVLWASCPATRANAVDRFYRAEWMSMPLLPRNISMPVRWLVPANNALTDFSRRFPSKFRPAGNKSLAFCVIMAFAARYRYDLSIPLFSTPDF